MRRFRASTPIRSTYVRKDGREVAVPIQDWTEAELNDYLKRYAAGMRRKRRTQKQR